MRLQLLTESTATSKKEFDYSTIADEMWRKKCKEAHDKFDIHFDHENDDDMAEARDIGIDQNFWDMSDCKFRCELRQAGGDWENPSQYFRCQLLDGYAKDLSHYSDPYFCVIPDGDNGNTNLIKSDSGGWVATGNSDVDGEDLKDQKCWKFLKEHLAGLVDEKIKETKAERQEDASN
jgi:hypothetical protein